jgi:hypothetical protein
MQLTPSNQVLPTIIFQPPSSRILPPMFVPRRRLTTLLQQVVGKSEVELANLLLGENGREDAVGMMRK